MYISASNPILLNYFLQFHSVLCCLLLIYNKKHVPSPLVFAKHYYCSAEPIVGEVPSYTSFFLGKIQQVYIIVKQAVLSKGPTPATFIPAWAFKHVLNSFLNQSLKQYIRRSALSVTE